MNQQRRVVKWTAIWLIGLGMFATLGTASAERTDEVTRSVSVVYRSLLVNTPEGTEALHSRLRDAAQRACGYYEPKDLRARRRWQECSQAALDDALERVGGQAAAVLRR